MPSKRKKYNARFPPARIKKIMQSDEEVGKVAQAVPVIISRALELFVESLLKKAEAVTHARNAKTLTPSHLKQCIMAEQKFDFLKDVVSAIPDVQGDEDVAETPTPRSAVSNSSFVFPTPSATSTSTSSSFSQSGEMPTTTAPSEETTSTSTHSYTYLQHQQNLINRNPVGISSSHVGNLMPSPMGGTEGSGQYPVNPLYYQQHPNGYGDGIAEGSLASANMNMYNDHKPISYHHRHPNQFQ